MILSSKLSDDTLRQLCEEFSLLTPERQGQVNANAAMPFCNLQMLGLGSSDLPQMVPQLTAEQVAKLRLLAITVEGVFASHSSLLQL